MDAIANSAPKKAPATDRAAQMKMPVACFMIFDRVTEGIEMTHSHPLVPGEWALILGEKNYVARDRANNRGCLSEITDGRALTFRAKVGYFTAKSGRQTPVLQRPGHGEELHKALVVAGFGLNGARLGPLFETKPGTNEKRGLFVGVAGGNLIASDEGEALVEVSKSDTLTIFYPDGSVTEIRHEDLARFAYTGKRPESLSAKDALYARIEYIDGELKKAKQADPKDLDEDKRAKTIDRWFHELAAMIRLTKNLPNLRQPIFDLIDNHVEDRLRGGVQKHLREVLEFVNDRSVHSWLEGTNDGRMIERMFPGRGNERRGTPAKELKRKRDRAENDRKVRAAMQTKGGSKDKSGSA